MYDKYGCYVFVAMGMECLKFDIFNESERVHIKMEILSKFFEKSFIINFDF